jgi:hypothetical protein
MGCSCETSHHAVNQFARLLRSRLSLKGWHTFVSALDQRIQQLLIALPRRTARIGKSSECATRRSFSIRTVASTHKYLDLRSCVAIASIHAALLRSDLQDESGAGPSTGSSQLTSDGEAGLFLLLSSHRYRILAESFQPRATIIPANVILDTTNSKITKLEGLRGR